MLTFSQERNGSGGGCLGFSWNRFDFLHSIWYGAMFWLQEKNSVNNALMFQLLLSSAAQGGESFTFHCPASEGTGGAQEAGRGQN